jgi:EmrB/QacA subfamily drug resistance transporter
MVVISGLLTGTLIAALDQNIVATALPNMVSDLGGLAHISWVVTAYLLASTLSTPLHGKLGDLFGRARLFRIAIVVFVIGSVLSGTAQTMPQLIAFRSVQGIGAGGLIVGAQAIIGEIVAPAERGRYQGYTASVWAVASVIGPFIGGVFTEKLSWRWAFYINVPIGAAALVVTSAVLKLAPGRHRVRIDWTGAAVLSGAAAALVLATTGAFPTHRWWLVCGGAALVGAFIVIERRAAEPVLPLRLFGNGNFRVGSGLAAVVGFAVLGTTPFLPLYLQVVNGRTPVEAGLQMTPVMLSLVVTSVVCGRLIVRRGRYKIFPIVGTLSMTLGLVLLSRMTPDTRYTLQAAGMVLLGVGIGATVQVTILTAQNSVPPGDLGVATSTVTFFRSMGASAGVAVFGALFSARLADGLHARSAVRLPDGVGGLTPKEIAALDPTTRHLLVSSFANALGVVFMWAVPVVVLAVVLSLFLREVPLRVRAAPSPITE